MSLLHDIQEYIGFGPADAQALRAFAPLVRDRLPRIAAHFYEMILAHPSAHAAITGGEAQVQRLRQTLADWMESGLMGPHDQTYWERRTRIGRVHVEIGLPQRYMFTAMNVIRRDFKRAVEELIEGPDPGAPADRARARATVDALDRLFDMELAIMLHAYQQDSEDRLRTRERLAAVGQVAASIGHELRNPLGVMQSSVYLLRKRSPAPEARRHLDKLDKQVARCDRIITGLLELTRERPLQRASVDIDALLDDVEGALQSQIPDAPRIERLIPSDLRLYADGDLLRQALLNLMLNSAQAGARDQITVQARREGPAVVLQVTDDGPGFAPDTLPRAFEPLVTTRPRGTGLGLALVHSVAVRHGGTARATNLAAGGACVTLTLPDTPPEPAP